MSTSSAATVKWNDATVTQAGFRLQASMLQGGGFEFTRVIGADENGIAKVTLSLQPGTVAEAKITVPVLLSNAGLSEGFTMKQLQFYAKGTGAAPADEILYAVAQDSVGDYIPSAAESPGFTIDWSYTFQFGNADSVTVNLDPAGLVSFDIVGAANGVAPLGPDGKIPEEYMGDTSGSSIAPSYDAESTYSKGDYCIHEGQLYQANVDIDAPEAWDESHWTAVNIADQFISKSEKGAASGVATLDINGKLTAAQKPAYTAAEVGALPTAGGTMAGPINMAGQHITDLPKPSGSGDAVRKSDLDAVEQDIEENYAPLASPALTGTPTAPTAEQGDSSTKVATTEFVNASIVRLIGAAPGALDTLEELADALGDDPNFATSMTNLIAGKAPLNSPALTGTPTAPTPESGDSSTTIATTAFVADAVETGSEYTNMLDALEYETQLHGYIADRISKGGEIYVATPPSESDLPHLGLKDNPFRTLQEAANYLPEDLHGKTAVIYVLSRIKTITAESTTVYSWAAPENAYQSDTVIENVRNGHVWIQYGELEINETTDTWTMTEAEGNARGKLGRIMLKHCDNVTLVNFELNCNYATETHEEDAYYPAAIVKSRSKLFLWRCNITAGDYGAMVCAGSGFYICNDCTISNLTGAVMYAEAGAGYGTPKPASMSTLTLSNNAYFSITEQHERFSSNYYYFQDFYNINATTGQLTKVDTKYFDEDGVEVDYKTGEPVSSSTGS